MPHRFARALPIRLSLAVLLAILAFAMPAAAETVRITLLQVNDFDRMGESEGRGGFARFAAALKAERAKNGNLLVVHAGDAFSPSLLSGFDHGDHIVKLLNATKPDVFVPGNHEFDFGPENFRERIEALEMPVLAANLREASGARVGKIEDSRIVELGGVRLGIIGLANENATQTSTTGDLALTSGLDTARRLVPELRKAGADLIVLVAHEARSIDRQLVESRLADVVMSGDDQDLLVNYDGRTVLTEAYEQADYLVAIDLEVNIETAEGKRRISWHPNFRIIDTAAVTPDPGIAAIVQDFEGELTRELDVEIGTAVTELDSRRASVRTSETAIGNLFADALRAATKADVAIMNGGGIRANKVYPAGTRLTRRDILSEMPFGNRSIVVEVTGSQLKAALENGVSLIEDVGGRFPQVSGLSFTYAPKKPVGSRVLEVKVAGSPLDPAKTYRLATNDFMGRGGDGYTVLVDARRILREQDGNLIANDVMSYIRRLEKVEVGVEGRIVAVE